MLSGGSGDDRIDGGPGADAESGGSEDDHLVGGAGSDRLAGDAGKDSVSGGAGNDALAGGSGNDTVAGGAGDDAEDGGSGDDHTAGDTGADVITPGDGLDGAFGGSGNDAFQLGDGDLGDTIDGGTGITSCYYEKTGIETPACRPPLTKTYITAMTFSTRSIDTTTSAQTVHVEVFAENDVADVAAIQVGAGLTSATDGGVDLGLTFSSGTARNGWWSGDLVFPQASAPGTYAINAHTQDVNGTQQTWYRIAPGYGSPFHGPSTIVQTGAGDTQPPRIIGLELDRRSVDTSAADAIVHVRAHITDDLLGTSLVVGYLEHRGAYRRADLTLQRTSGSAVDGIWEGDVTLPHGAPQGTWQLNLTARDPIRWGGYVPDSLPHVVEQTGAGGA